MKTIDNIYTLFKDSQGDLTTVLSKIFHNDIKIFILNVLIIYLKHLKTLFQNRLNKLISISLYGNIFYYTSNKFDFQQKRNIPFTNMLKSIIILL